MIHYETNNSPFFIENKNYCENIASKLKTINHDCSGFCNSFGYDIETTFSKNNLTYNLKFHKHQSTQDGMIIPVDARNYEWTDVTISGLNNKNRVSAGKSSLRRLLNSKRINEKIPSPYFISFKYTPENSHIDNLVKNILDNKISKLKLDNGKLDCKIHLPTTDPLELIADLEILLKTWAHS